VGILEKEVIDWRGAKRCDGRSSLRLCSLEVWNGFEVRDGDRSDGDPCWYSRETESEFCAGERDLGRCGSSVRGNLQMNLVGDT
jgi:hypothetical protein